MDFIKKLSLLGIIVVSLPPINKTHAGYAAPIENPNPAISDTLNSHDSPLVSLLIKKDDGSFRCTGTQVAANIILTARHCVEIKPNQYIGRDTLIAVNKKIHKLVNARILTRSKDALNKSKNTEKGMIQPSEMESDLALLLVRPLTCSPWSSSSPPIAKIQTTPLDPSTRNIIIAGSGLISPQNENEHLEMNGGLASVISTQNDSEFNALIELVSKIPGARPDPRSPNLLVTALYKQTLTGYRSFDPSVSSENIPTELYEKNASGILPGDSGGPALIKSPNGELVVVGVASAHGGGAYNQPEIIEAIDTQTGNRTLINEWKMDRKLPLSSQPKGTLDSLQSLGLVSHEARPKPIRPFVVLKSKPSITLNFHTPTTTPRNANFIRKNLAKLSMIRDEMKLCL